MVEEIKLAPAQGAPDAAVPEHRAQAVCYAHLLGEARAVVRVLYVTRAGDAVACFEETLDAPALADEFSALAAPYLARLEARLRWRGVRDASLRTLAFPFPAYREGQRALAAQAYWARPVAPPPVCARRLPARAKPPPSSFPRSRRWAKG